MNGIFVLPSSTRIQFQKISTYQVCFCIKIWANIVAGNRCIQICLSCQVFFCNADFTLYACFFLAGYHLKCFGDGCISAGDVFEKEEEDGISDCWIAGGCLLIRGMRKWLGGKIPCISITRHCWRRRYIILSCVFPRINSAFCAAKYSFFKSMRWSNCNSTFLLAQAAGTKYKISGNFIIFEIRLSKINNKTNGNSNCGQFHLRYIWKIFDAFSSLNLGRCYFSV